MSTRTNEVLGWLMLALALVLGFCSVVSWRDHTRLFADEFNLLMTALFTIGSLVAFAFAWGFSGKPESVLAAALYVTGAAAGGWVVFLLISETYMVSSIAALLAICVGGPVGIALVMLVIARLHMRKPQ